MFFFRTKRRDCCGNLFGVWGEAPEVPSKKLEHGLTCWVLGLLGILCKIVSSNQQLSSIFIAQRFVVRITHPQFFGVPKFCGFPSTSGMIIWEVYSFWDGWKPPSSATWGSEAKQGIFWSRFNHHRVNLWVGQSTVKLNVNFFFELVPGSWWWNMGLVLHYRTTCNSTDIPRFVWWSGDCLLEDCFHEWSSVNHQYQIINNNNNKTIWMKVALKRQRCRSAVEWLTGIIFPCLKSNKP